jgi:hypothetical protein
MGGGGSTKIKDTPAQKSLARIAAQRFNLYQQYFVPLENQFISDVFTMKQPEFQKARGQLEQRAFQQGVDPTSGQFRGTSQQFAQTQARGMGLGTAEALSGQTDRYYQGLQNIIALGEGQAGKTMSGLADVADIARQRSTAEAKTEFARSSMLGEVAGTGLGLGAGYAFSNRSGGGG